MDFSEKKQNKTKKTLNHSTLVVLAEHMIYKYLIVTSQLF